MTLPQQWAAPAASTPQETVVPARSSRKSDTTVTAWGVTEKSGTLLPSPSW